MIKIQELSGAMPMHPHQGCAPGYRGGAVEGLPPTPANAPLDPAVD